MGPPAFGKAFLLFCQTETLKTGVYNCHGNSTLTLIDPDAFFPVRHNQNSVFYSTSLAGYDTAPMARAFLTHVYLSRLRCPFLKKYLYLYTNMAEQNSLFPFLFPVGVAELIQTLCTQGSHASTVLSRGTPVRKFH